MLHVVVLFIYSRLMMMTPTVQTYKHTQTHNIKANNVFIIKVKSVG